MDKEKLRNIVLFIVHVTLYLACIFITWMFYNHVFAGIFNLPHITFFQTIEIQVMFAVLIVSFIQVMYLFLNKGYSDEEESMMDDMIDNEINNINNGE